jgi:hypothetical protein
MPHALREAYFKFPAGDFVRSGIWTVRVPVATGAKQPAVLDARS